MRIKAEELNKEQDNKYVALCLADISEKVLPESAQDLEDMLNSCRHRIARNVASSDTVAAEILFNTKYQTLGPGSANTSQEKAATEEEAVTGRRKQAKQETLQRSAE